MRIEFTTKIWKPGTIRIPRKILYRTWLRDVMENHEPVKIIIIYGEDCDRE